MFRVLAWAAGCFMLAAAGRADESAQVLALGGAGAALTGRPDAWLSNPAHLGGLDRWSFTTGFAAGASADSREGLNKDNRPSSLWASLSESSLLAPLGDTALVAFSTHVKSGSSFRAAYDRTPLYTQYQDSGGLVDVKGNIWFRGLASGRKLGLDSSLGLALGVMDYRESSTLAYEESTPNKYNLGYDTQISQTISDRVKGLGFGLVLGGRYRIRKQLQAGATVSWFSPLKLKAEHSSYIYRETEPDHGLYPDLRLSLEGDSQVTLKPPLTASLGFEGRPTDDLKLLLEVQVRTGAVDQRLSWVERDEGPDYVLHPVLWDNKTLTSLAGSFGAEYQAARWGLRLGFRSLPSGADKITDELRRQTERVDMRAVSLGVGFKNPFFLFDLGYAYAWGRGDAKAATAAAYPAPETEVQSVTLIPIHRRESHLLLLSFGYIF